MASDDRVWAVVVTYRPAEDPFRLVLAKIVAQVNHVLVIDNGSDADLEVIVGSVAGNCGELVRLGENLGVARAQNEGIGRVVAAGVPYVVIFDQDSEPQPGLVDSLLKATRLLRAEGNQVAAVGANYAEGTETPFRKIRGGFTRRCACASPSDLVPVDYLISSGCLIATELFQIVGPMHEALFIDYVDTEWCLRAKLKGYSSFGVCAARLRHCLGDRVGQVGRREFTLRSPLRHYYMFRNGIWLYLRSSLPAYWKMADGFNLLLKFFAYPAMSRPHLTHFRFIMLGIYHGIIGRLGKLP